MLVASSLTNDSSADFNGDGDQRSVVSRGETSELIAPGGAEKSNAGSDRNADTTTWGRGELGALSNTEDGSADIDWDFNIAGLDDLYSKVSSGAERKVGEKLTPAEAKLTKAKRLVREKVFILKEDKRPSFCTGVKDSNEAELEWADWRSRRMIDVG